MTLTRDSLSVTITFVSAVLTFLADSMGLVQKAFPALTSTGQARIALVTALVGFIAGWMKMSPLALSPKHPLATDESSVILSPVDSEKIIKK